MKWDQTICFKINRCIDNITNAVKGKGLDIQALSIDLHEIRTSAQHMESGLKLRKKLMIEAGIEEKYQALFASENTPTKNGINTIANASEVRPASKIRYEFTVKEDGKVVYQSPAHAGVIDIVEEIEDIDDQGIINGKTQRFIFGHPLAIWYAFDQLQQAIEARRLEILIALKKAVGGKMFSDPVQKKKILEAMNGV